MGCFQALEVLKIASGQGCILYLPNFFVTDKALFGYVDSLHQFFLSTSFKLYSNKLLNVF